MSRSSFLILLGILTAIAPFSGLPSSWLAALLPVLGLSVAGAGFSIRLQGVREEARNALTSTTKNGGREVSGTSATRTPEETSPSSHGVSPI